jgi:hypothetical protein
MVSLAGIVGNNSVGYMHKLVKVDRAIRNSANRLLEQVLIERKETHRIPLANGDFHEVYWGTPDVARLRKCFEHIAHGLHWHHFRTPFVGHLTILLGYLFHSDHNSRTWVDFIRARAELDLRERPRLGSNQDVFYYQVTEPDEFSLFMMRLVFYGGVNVYVAFTPKDAKPPHNIVMELMAQGIPTIVTLGDKSFEFNSK